MTALVDRPLEEWAVSRALFPTRLTQERCAKKKRKEKKKKKGGKNRNYKSDTLPYLTHT